MKIVQVKGTRAASPQSDPLYRTQLTVAQRHLDQLPVIGVEIDEPFVSPRIDAGTGDVWDSGGPGPAWPVQLGPGAEPGAVRGGRCVRRWGGLKADALNHTPGEVYRCR